MSTMTDRRHGRRIFAVSGLGTAMEYYDFTIYGLAAALVFPAVFFPQLDPLLGALVAFSAFGVGFIVRPLGGIIIGHFGDRVGRKPVLVLTLVLMGISTFIIGCLPGHAVLGNWAVVALVLLRLIQGFAAGGEWGGAAVVGIEAAPRGRRGLWGSFTSMGVGLGTLLGTIAFTIVSAVEGGQPTDLGWRIPFWLGGGLVIIGLIARLRLPREDRPEGGAPRVPLIEAVRSRPRQVVGGVMISFGWNTCAYVISVFFLAYVAQHGYDRTTALIFQVVSTLTLLLSALFFGHLSDRFGRRPVMLAGAGALVVAFFSFFPITLAGVVWVTAVLFILIGFVAAAALGPLPSLLGEQFPARVRYSGISVTYQIGAALGGGTASAVATALLIWNDGNPTGVAIYAAGAAVILALGVLMLRETARSSPAELAGAAHAADDEETTRGAVTYP